jgi:hypothetical protein
MSEASQNSMCTSIDDMTTQTLGGNDAEPPRHPTRVFIKEHAPSPEKPNANRAKKGLPLI